MDFQNPKVFIGGMILLAFILVFLPFYASAYLLTLVITTLHFIFLAQSWNFVFGYSGQLSLGHGVFYGICGYFSTKLFLNFFTSKETKVDGIGGELGRSTLFFLIRPPVIISGISFRIG